VPRSLKLLTCCCLLPLLAACSTTRLAYDHLDTLLRWQASKYVDLNARQRQSLDTELQQLWTWHRHTQLPLYAADLRQLAATAQAGPLSREQLEAVSAKIRGDWDRIVEQALPGYARAHVLLSDAQVADMIQRIGKEIERRSRKALDRSESEQRAHMVERMNDTLRDWIGRPNARQHELIEQWGAQVQLATPEQTQERHSTLDRYAAVLATRAQPGFEQRMREFFLGPTAADDPQSLESVERQRWLQLLADLSTTLEPAQREHLCKKLLGYAADFEALAAEPG
jgi:hypothetical protein